MKKSLLYLPVLFSLAFTFSALAQPLSKSTPVLMSCATNPLTTSYQMLAVDEGYELHVVHHNGTKYMPIFSGAITPNDLELLHRRAEYLQQMGPSAKIFFKAAECSHNGPVWKCFSNRPVQLGSLKAAGVSFYMFERQTSSNNYSFNTMETFLSFRQKEDHLQYDITSSYSFEKRDCNER